MNSLNQYFSGTTIMIWLSLFPVTYLVHIAEEYCGGDGYSAYLFKHYGVELSQARFLALQTVGLLLMIAGVFLAVRLRFPCRMLAILASVVLVNGAVHSARSIASARYEPGLVTAILLWMPLGATTLMSLWGTMTSASFSFAVSIGVTISGLVEMIAMRGGKLLNS